MRENGNSNILTMTQGENRNELPHVYSTPHSVITVTRPRRNRGVLRWRHGWKCNEGTLGKTNRFDFSEFHFWHISIFILFTNETAGKLQMPFSSPRILKLPPAYYWLSTSRATAKEKQGLVENNPSKHDKHHFRVDGNTMSLSHRNFLPDSDKDITPRIIWGQFSLT